MSARMCAIAQETEWIVAAGAFRALLTAPGARFAGRFEHVVFAVLDRRADPPARAAFAAAFPG
jgi:hypothetical protein